MLTLHGDAAQHNRLTANPNAYAALLAAAEYIRDSGLFLRFNLMVNRHFPADWASIAAVLKRFPQAESRFAIPLYMPTARLWAYQRQRVTRAQGEALLEMVQGGQTDTAQLADALQNGCETRVHAQLKQALPFDYRKEKAKAPDWMFLHADSQMNLYHGNVGAHTELLGNLAVQPAVFFAEKIAALPPNYDFYAYYDLEKLPPMETLLARIDPAEHDFLYPSAEDCVLRWVDSLGVENLLIP